MTVSCHLRAFLSDSVSSTGDMESAEEEDHFISSIADDDTRQQLRWCRYLSRLNSTAWGDHIAVQGLADMLHVDIHIIATSNPDMEPIKSCHPAIGVFKPWFDGSVCTTFLFTEVPRVFLIKEIYITSKHTLNNSHSRNQCMSRQDLPSNAL